MTFRLKLNKKEGGADISAPPSFVSKGYNCLSCARFSICNNPSKAFDFVCGLYEKKSQSLETLHASISIPEINRSNNYSDLEKLNITNDEELELLLSKIVHQFSTGILRDLKVDDSDLPLAKNFVDFSYNPDFVGHGEQTYPFAKQTEMALHLFSDYCPKCSNQAYVHDIPVDHTIDKILEQVQLLDNGVCPKCKQNRLDFWSKPEYKYKRFRDLIGIAGQRCITGSSRVLTWEGIQKMSNIAKKYKKGFAVVLENGKTVKTSDFYKVSEEQTVLIRTDNGLQIEGTLEHPIKTQEGYTKLRDIVVGQTIPIYIGQNIWGKKPLVNKKIAKLLGYLINKKIPNCILQSPKNIVNVFIKTLFKRNFYIIDSYNKVYVSKSKTHILDISVILNNYGIIHSAYKNRNNHIIYIPTTHKNIFDVDYSLSLYLTTIAHKSYPTKKKVTYDFHIPTHHRFMANGLLNHNSGKTAGVNRLQSYQLHRWLKLNRPQKVFSLEENVGLEMCFTATTFSKALENFYDPLVYTLNNNDWYIEYHKLLDYYGKKHGQELYKILGVTTFYNHRNYIICPKSPDPSNMRGSTRILAMIDELAHLWAKSNDAKKLNPQEVHNVLSNSLVTVRMAYNKLVRKGLFDIPAPIMCNVTSPRSINDYGMKLYRLAQDEFSQTYSFHYSVFQMNPNAKDDEELEQIRRERPEDFKRDFMAIPPSAANAFIEDKNIVKAAVKDKLVNAITLKQGSVQSHAKNVKMMSAKFEIRKGKVNKKSNKLLALDAGSRFNSFAFCVAHLDVQDHGEFEEVTKIYDIIGEIIPENDRTISFSDVYSDVLAPIIEEFNVIHISADRWSSHKLLQDAANEFGIIYSQYSCKMKDFIEYKSSLYSGDIKIPMPELKIDEAFELATYNYPACFKGKPVAHAMLQMLTVENYIKSVEKGHGYTDDIFRSMVLANHFLNDEGVIEELLAPTDPIQDDNEFVGAIASGSGNVTGIGGSNIQASNKSGPGGIIAGIGAIVSSNPFGKG